MVYRVIGITEVSDGIYHYWEDNGQRTEYYHLDELDDLYGPFSSHEYATNALKQYGQWLNSGDIAIYGGLGNQRSQQLINR